MKYKLKRKPQLAKMIEHTRLCINCGKEDVLFLPEFRPRPNTPYLGEPSWLQCKLGNHYFYYADELELIK